MNTVETILNLLKSQNKTQKELTAFLGINEGSVADWKKGKTKSYKKHIDKIADFFNVSVDYLLGTSPTIQAYDENDNQVIIDDETREIIDQFRDRPELKDLMKVGDKLTKAQLISVLRMIQTMTEDK